MDKYDEFEKWQELWDKAAKKMAEDAAEQQVKASFFTNTVPYEDNGELEDKYGWNDVLNRSNDLNYNPLHDNVLNEDGYRDLVKDKGVLKHLATNPYYLDTIGPDQEGKDGHVRVTNNWSDGEELKQVDELKRKIEEMERKAHESDVLKKSSRSRLKKELEGLRNRVKKLSEKMQSKPAEDVT